MESDDDNYVEEEESELSCYDLFTQNLPIQIAGSEKYGGKGVIVRNNVEAGEELYEEEPIFSWMVGEDVVEHLRQHMGRCVSSSFLSCLQPHSRQNSFTVPIFRQRFNEILIHVERISFFLLFLLLFSISAYSLRFRIYLLSERIYWW